MANLTIIVAVADNGVIGRSDTNTLPWRLPEDMKLFRKRTLNHTVIMGRKTWDSLPKKPLAERQNIVVSKKVFGGCVEPIEQDGKIIAQMCGSIESAIALAQHGSYSETTGVFDRNKEIFLIGGSQLYELALSKGLVNKIVMSKVAGKFEGDVLFPHLPANSWDGTVESLFSDFDIWVYKKKVQTI